MPTVKGLSKENWNAIFSEITNILADNRPKRKRSRSASSGGSEAPEEEDAAEEYILVSDDDEWSPSHSSFYICTKFFSYLRFLDCFIQVQNFPCRFKFFSLFIHTLRRFFISKIFWLVHSKFSILLRAINICFLKSRRARIITWWTRRPRFLNKHRQSHDFRLSTSW